MRIMRLLSNTSRIGPVCQLPRDGWDRLARAFGLNIGMNKDGSPCRYRFRPSHDRFSHLGWHQSFRKSVEVENIVIAAALDLPSHLVGHSPHRYG
jgi:hypothetical protein